MSPSTKSSSESPSSPETGSADVDAAPAPVGRVGRPVNVELEVSRQRTAMWSVFGIVVGALCVWKLGTVGVWGGFALIAAGIYHTYELVQTFLHEPGTIVVTETTVSLPRGLCTSKPMKLAPKDVTAAYLLRRSVPFHRAAPVLVVEIGATALIYPRDWFATEADQRDVVEALCQRSAGA